LNKRIVFITTGVDHANIRRIGRLKPTMSMPAMLSDGLRVLADKLEAEQEERANAPPVPFAKAVEDLYG